MQCPYYQSQVISIILFSGSNACFLKVRKMLLQSKYLLAPISLQRSDLGFWFWGSKFALSMLQSVRHCWMWTSAPSAARLVSEFISLPENLVLLSLGSYRTWPTTSWCPWQWQISSSVSLLCLLEQSSSSVVTSWTISLSSSSNSLSWLRFMAVVWELVRLLPDLWCPGLLSVHPSPDVHICGKIPRHQATS